MLARASSTSRRRHYGGLDVPHEAVHSSTRDVFALLDQEPLDYAAITDVAQAMETASREVFDYLDRIRSDVERWSDD